MHYNFSFAALFFSMLLEIDFFIKMHIQFVFFWKIDFKIHIFLKLIFKKNINSNQTIFIKAFKYKYRYIIDLV